MIAFSVKKIAILGTRGIPARHGGFETFVESFAPYLVQQGLVAQVYCQSSNAQSQAISSWKGVELISISPRFSGALATFNFDLKSILDVIKQKPDLVMVFGYNTALICFLLKIKKIPFVMNMDGLEWKRKKWNFLFKIWLWLNEKLGCCLADHLIADHPEIQKRLARFKDPKKITTIAYGAERIENANQDLLKLTGDLGSGGYGVFIGRPEPENHVLEMVRAFSAKPRGMKLIVLGDYSSDKNSYKQNVVRSASAEVVFPGAIYDGKTVEALLFFSRFYCHGHSVGGTNPSLVQAMAAGCSIIAHDNVFNRGVLIDQAQYFKNQAELEIIFDNLGSIKPCRKFYPQLLSPEIVHQRYLRVFESVTLAEEK